MAELERILSLFEKAMTVKMKDTAVQQEINKQVAGQRAMCQSVLAMQTRLKDADATTRDATAAPLARFMACLKANPPLLATYDSLKKEEASTIVVKT